MNFFTQLRAAIRAGRFSKKSGGTGEHADMEARAQAKETKESERIEKIEALLESVNSASQHVRNFYITFLLAGFYIAVIIWSTTDVMLLKDTPVNLPILNVKLSITGFYTFAPFFFLLLHFNLLLQLCLLADKVHRFDGVVIELADHNLRRYYYTRLFAFAFTHTLSGRQHSGFLRFLLTLLVWITIIWLPLVVLVGLQVGFLAYHDETILFWQRLAVSLDVLILAVFWPIIRSVDGKWRSWFKQATGISWFIHCVQRLWNKTTDDKTAATQHKPPHQPVNFNSGRPMLEGSLSLITAFSVLLFSWGIAVLPDSKTEQAIGKLLPDSWLTDEPLSDKNPDGERYFWLTEYFFDKRYDVDDQNKKIIKSGVFNRNLVLKEQLLIANELSAEDEWHIRHGNESERKAALKKVRALILSDRNLRYADFSEAILPKVDFVGADDNAADLEYANFENAILHNARMRYVKLQKANLRRAKLQEADLRDAKLQQANLRNVKLLEADLKSAKLQGADLNGGELKRADLRWANLQGVNLDEAKLQEADLSHAQLNNASLYRAWLQDAELGKTELQKADLRHAKLQGAVFVNAWLQSADLFEAKLQGANLSGAKLQGANLVKAELQGAYLGGAQLQGANLYAAKLQGSNLSWVALHGADLTGAKLQGAILWLAELQGADLSEANLQGVDLAEAQLQGAKLLNANIRLANIADAIFGRFTGESVEDWMDNLAVEVDDEKLLNQIHTRLSDRIDQATLLDGVYGEKIWGDRQYLNIINTSGSPDSSDYLNSLITYWIELACSDSSTAVGIIYNRLVSIFVTMPLAAETAQCMLYLRDQRNRKGKRVCPALSEINVDTHVLLREIAADEQPDDAIQATFECKTALSDP